MDLFTWTLASVTSTATLTSIVTSFFDAVAVPYEWTLNPYYDFSQLFIGWLHIKLF